jgi:hypothetical protein
VVWFNTGSCFSGGGPIRQTVAGEIFGDLYDDPDACPPP